VATFDFSLIQDDLQRVEHKLHELAAVDFPPLAGILGQLLKSGGKRLRPALVLLSADFYGATRDETISIAAAVETLHTATLVHDDLIDNSLLRRGNPTLNTNWPSGVVVLVGDYLFGKSAELASRARSIDMGELFARTVATICDGEVRSMLNGSPWAITREQYDYRIYAKTASLFATCTEAGAIVAGAPEGERALLREYGRSLGMAFQITDDILDFVGNEKTLGKPVGSDLRQGTVTLPALCYFESHPDDPALRELSSGAVREDAFDDLIDRIRASGAIAAAYKDAHRFSLQAKEALSTLPQGRARRVLLDLADFVVDRRT